MTQDNNPENKDKGRIETPLPESARTLTRRCKDCSGVMQAEAREEEDSTFPWREVGIRFSCGSCNKTAWIANTDCILVSLFSGLLIVSGIIYMLANDLLGFISYSFDYGVGWILLSLLLLVVVVVFAAGALYNIKRGLNLLQVKRHYPVIDAPNRTSSITAPILLGLAPWLMAGGIGYLNYTYFDDNDAVALIAAPLIVIPIMLAKRFGCTKMEVVMAMIIWFGFGTGTAWLLDVF